MQKHLLLPFLLFICSLSFAQNAKKSPCDRPEYKQFDFWVGDWDVEAKGKPAGTNHIVKMQNECIIQENWTSAGSPFTGTSYNFYNPESGKWQQIWLDNQGSNLQLEGGWDGKSMVMESQMVTWNDGSKVIHRVSWTPNPDGSVRQHWQRRQIHGYDWTTVFDGIYRKKK